MNTNIQYDTETTILNNEEWVDVIGYDGYYQISNMGRLKSLEREIPNSRGFGTRVLKEKIKRLKWHNKRNQIECQYCINGVKKVFNFAKQIALHFVKDYNNEPIYHKDGNVFNCKIDNLKVITKHNILEIYNNNNMYMSNDSSELLHSMGVKRCSVCKTIKKHDEFSKQKRNRGVHNNCKKCSNELYLRYKQIKK